MSKKYCRIGGDFLKSLYNEAIELFGEQQYLTEEEEKALTDGLEKISQPTDRNFFELIEEND